MSSIKLQHFFARNSYLFALVIMAIAIYINRDLQDNLFEDRALNSNFRAFLPLMLVAVGQTLVIIGGGIDLSVGAIITMTNAILATRITADSTELEIYQTILYACGAGMLAGAFNGLCIAYMRLQPIVTTYATSFIYGGVALYILPRPEGRLPRELTRGIYRNLFDFKGFVTTISADAASLVPDGGRELPFTAYMVILTLLAWLLLRSTRYAQFLYASGGKPEAAYSSGVPVRAVKFSTYVLAGLMATLAGLALTLETGGGSTRLGDAKTLESIVVVVLGGTRLSGGQGGVTGTLIGVIILVLIRNIISFADWIPSDYDTLVSALIIIAALALPGVVSQIRKVWKERQVA